MPQQATIQLFIRCPAELADRFGTKIEGMSPKPSRNAVLVHLIEEWVKEQEKEQDHE